MRKPILKVAIRDELDVVIVRQRTKHLSEHFGFDSIESTRFATAVSELARNAFVYAGGGAVDFHIDTDQVALVAQVVDQGPGVRDLDAILDGRYRSTTGMGVGLIGAKRLSDIFDIESTASGTTVIVGKRLPHGKPLSNERLQNVVQQLHAQPVAASALIDARIRNVELVEALDVLHARQAEIERLSRELEETNRGVLALYSELDEKAESLKQASELKSRFLSQMSHELRTPLNSIIMLARLMQSGVDGPLPPEVQKQAAFIHRAADGLLELVNDLLDLAKIEAGRVDVVAREVSIPTLWSALRGMFRPLISDLPVELIFSDAEQLPTLFTDDVKLSQVLRNLISNAVKFTKNGHVRVAAEPTEEGMMQFSVVDTGIGIPVEHQAALFTEFVQLSEAAGYKQKGTGLGLALSRRLVEMLGGRIWCESAPGEGSTFTFVIPIEHGQKPQPAASLLREAPGGVA